MRSINQYYFLIAITCFLSCKADEELTTGLMEANLSALVQSYTVDLNTADNRIVFETDAGCEFDFSATGFSNNGAEVTGEIEVIEIFDKGTMAITGMHTMSQDSILISGGEFNVRAFQNEQELDYNSTYRVIVPVSLTGSYSLDMQLFTRNDRASGVRGWISAPNISDTWGVFGQTDSLNYLLSLTGFGWFNCDRFRNDSRPSVALDIIVPSQFDSKNSIIYLAIKGEKSSLGDASQGKYPVGLDAHLIFVTETDDEFMYQIISGELSEAEYKFDRDEMQAVSSSELQDVINGLE